MNEKSVIRGEWRCKEIYIDGFRLGILRSQKVYDHSQEYNWGYSGSGPAQTALALLLEAGASDEEASLWHEEFKADKIAGLNQRDFEMKADEVVGWIDYKRGTKTDDTPVDITPPSSSPENNS